jgi:hypothetical protein
MSAALRVVTWLLLLLLALFLYLALVSEPPANAVLFVVFLVVGLIYASVWFMWRPARFEVDARVLRIVWPIRAREIRRDDVEGAQVLDLRSFRDKYGSGMRIGAGGLWGGFGLLKTRKATFSMWISRLHGLVIVRLHRARPLLLTPEDPERFVEMFAKTQASH